jgi:putative DNA primase/helicase
LRVEKPAATCGFSLQPSTFHAFRESVEGLDRGTGFIARALFSNPESTQGTRRFKDPPESLPALTAFRERIKERLGVPLTYDENWALSPPVLSFTPEAKAEWVDFYNEVENELGPGGEMSEARDIASKAADNVARLAALLHVFEHGPAGNIGAAHVQAATRIVTWHLYQARREFCELAPTPEMLNAQKLEAWLVRRVKEFGELQIRTQTALKYGPGSTRHRAELDAALTVLTKAKRARIVKPPGSRTELIEVNPALLEGA